jgi:uncharacterized protein involved in response to NO
MPAPSRKPAADISAHLAFFPAAILGGLVAIPLWAVLSRDRPELALWHGHEMLLGYGLAVVAGFLLARIRRGLLIVLLGAWGLARIAAPLGVPALGTAAALAFAALLAGIASSRFLRAAKKSRNAMFGLMVVGLAGAEALYQAGALGLVGDGEARGLRLALDLLALLMLQMGGRVIPAATAGALQRRGGYLAARVQPRIEAAIGALMAAVIVGDQVAGGEAFADLARLLVAALALVRLLRWRPWAVVDVPALISLHLGYAWLAAGLALGGAGAFAGRSWSMAGIHALGIGALGTLTLTMMARTAATRRAPDAPVPGSILPVVLLLSVAAVLRIAAAFAAPPLLLIGAAAAWTLAFLAFAALYLRIAKVDKRMR